MIVDHRTAFFSDVEEQWESLNGSLPFQPLREKAWHKLQQTNFPTRLTEAYKYFPTHLLYKEHFNWRESSQLTIKDVEPFILPECEQSYITFVGGHLNLDLSCTEGIEGGGIVRSLSEAARSYGAFIHGRINQQIEAEEDAFALNHQVFYQGGVFIYLPAKTKIDVPIQIINIGMNRIEACMALPKVQVYMGKGSAASCIVSSHTLGDEPLFSHVDLDILLEESSSFHCTQLVCNPGLKWAFSTLRATLKSKAKLQNLHIASPGSHQVRFDYGIDLLGEDAQVDLNGAGISMDHGGIHTQVDIRHMAPNTGSSQLFKGALGPDGLSAFSGKIFVDSIAQQTDAFQLCQHLLLDASAKAYAKPGLEIYADDVKASHGATSGPLEIAPSFYAAARGIDEKTIRRLLICAHFKELSDSIRVEGVEQIFRAHLERFCAAN